MAQAHRPLKVYFAGDLFDHKHLVGNALLADAIDRMSGGRYSVYLPQNKESTTHRDADTIKNLDLEHVLRADCAVFNFDGTDLDSGTVVEFCHAKMVDIPSVQFRTDFRNSGDQGGAGDPWNVMCSNYPRTETLCMHALAIYQGIRQSEGGDVRNILNEYHERLATQIIKKLDGVVGQESLFHGDKEKALQVYEWTVKAASHSLASSLPHDELVAIVNSKAEAGLI